MVKTKNEAMSLVMGDLHPRMQEQIISAPGCRVEEMSVSQPLTAAWFATGCRHHRLARRQGRRQRQVPPDLRGCAVFPGLMSPGTMAGAGGGALSQDQGREHGHPDQPRERHLWQRSRGCGMAPSNR